MRKGNPAIHGGECVISARRGWARRDALPGIDAGASIDCSGMGDGGVAIR
jgi:hypothetical protein